VGDRGRGGLHPHVSGGLLRRGVSPLPPGRLSGFRGFKPEEGSGIEGRPDGLTEELEVFLPEVEGAHQGASPGLSERLLLSWGKDNQLQALVGELSEYTENAK
jgi:hypothetical protein